MKTKNSPTSVKSRSWQPIVFLGVILAILFWRSFLTDYVHFSNDGPLGQQNVNWIKLPGALTGMWNDLNDVGYGAGSYSPSITGLINWLFGPVGFAKFYAPVALFIVGLSAWTFFRTLKLSALAATLGALAAMLNSTFFSSACWGVASQEIALGMDFFALALIVSGDRQISLMARWTRFALAGLCVGINVMEAADIGALYSLFIAAFIFYKSLTDESGAIAKKIVNGVSRVVIVAIFAGFIAAQTISSLIGTSISGIAGTGQDEASKAAQWDGATEWSLPKIETFSLFVPGLFGYKMDTPNDMMPQFQDAYRGGVYWGGVGRTPEIDRFFDSGAPGSPPSNPNDIMRFSGGQNYCGILIALIAAWTIAQSFRRQNSLFSLSQKKFIWFWLVVIVISLPLAWGRFAPLSKTSDSPLFYALLYHLPYFSTIRNPAKFLIFLNLGLVLLFALGVDAFTRRHLNPAAPKSLALSAQLKNWWAKAMSFDRKWTFACGGIFIASILGWMIYASGKNGLVSYLQKVGFSDEIFATQIAAFSIAQVGWFLLLFAIAIVLVILILAGYFSGPRAKLAGILLGAFLIFDLARADLPFIIHWNYKEKYADNPILDILKDKPYEHRVAGLPFETQQPLRELDNYFGGSGIYRIEWTQHHFPYYNIQCLDLIQMSRMAEDLKTYLTTISPHNEQEIALYARHWQLTNTRYLLGAAGFLEPLNQEIDPVQHRFRIVQRFDIVPQPGIAHPTGLEELTAVPAPDGDLALFEFTGALPRAKLYSNWQVNTNNLDILKTLADLNFDPTKTVLVSTSKENLPAVSTNENSGTVDFKSYAPTKIDLSANAVAPSILLLNDKFDPNWRVTVDGKPAELLRCNFLMRGVYLAPGQHDVEFRFSLPHQLLYVTLSAMALGIILLVYVIFSNRRQSANAPNQL
jgi:hypothetical protein